MSSFLNGVFMTDIGGEDYFVDIGGESYANHVLHQFHKIWPKCVCFISESQEVENSYNTCGEVVGLSVKPMGYKLTLSVFKNKTIAKKYDKQGITPSLEDSVILFITDSSKSAFTFSENNRDLIEKIHADYVNQTHDKEELIK